MNLIYGNTRQDKLPVTDNLYKQNAKQTSKYQNVDNMLISNVSYLKINNKKYRTTGVAMNEDDELTEQVPGDSELHDFEEDEGEKIE